MPRGARLTVGNRSKRLTLLFRVAFTIIIGGFGTQPAAADKPKTVRDEPTKRYARVTDPSLHVSAETGKACHQETFKNFDTTPHFVTTLENQRCPEWQGCEACHVPGKQYIQSGGDKTKVFSFKGVSAAGSSARWKKG